MAPQIIRDNFPTHVLQWLRLTLYLCPKVANASRSSRTAVGTSSKFSAEMAHRACFCAFIMEGARDGQVKNAEAIQSIVKNTSVKTELGGGLRDLETITYVIEKLGVSRAILGSVLLEKPELATQASLKYPDRIVLGIDARGGLVATRGWRETSSVKATDLVKEFAALPLAGVIYTDIARDGTLEGPNLDATAEMAEVSPFPVIASGGIGCLDDIKAVAKMAKGLKKGTISGIIVGKALYEKKFTVEEAIQAVS